MCWILEVISFVTQSDLFAREDVFHTFYSVCWILEVIYFVAQSDFFASQMFSTHSILCVGYLKSFLLSHSQISLLARCFPHTILCVGYLKSFLLSHSQIYLLARCFPNILFCVLDT